MNFLKAFRFSVTHTTNSDDTVRLNFHTVRVEYDALVSCTRVTLASAVPTSDDKIRSSSMQLLYRIQRWSSGSTLTIRSLKPNVRPEPVHIAKPEDLEGEFIVHVANPTKLTLSREYNSTENEYLFDILTLEIPRSQNPHHLQLRTSQ